MKEHNTHDTNKHHEIVENYTEEGAITHEAFNVQEPVHKRNHDGKTLITTPVAIIISAIIIAGGLMGYGFITSGGNQSAPKTAFLGKAIGDTDYVEGKTNAKVVIVEYSDPECPYCGQVSSTIKKIRTDYSGKVAFVYRHFPLTQIHKNAFDTSRAIACAGKIGGKDKYYAYIDTLYGYIASKQSVELKPTSKEDFAKTVGLDMPAFTACMKENQTAQEITDSIQDGVTAGVQGTPSTFVLVKTRKGYDVVSMVDGARPAEYFKTVIDEALAR